MQQRHKTMKKALILAALLASVTATKAVPTLDVKYLVGGYQQGVLLTAYDTDDTYLTGSASTITKVYIDDLLVQSSSEERFYSGRIKKDYPFYVSPGLHTVRFDFYPLGGDYAGSLFGEYTAVHAPDGGATAAMLGIGIAALAFARRKLA
jgi:hypothetical protein